MVDVGEDGDILCEGVGVGISWRTAGCAKRYNALACWESGLRMSFGLPWRCGTCARQVVMAMAM
jgi:hypothetical protein